MSNLFSGKVSRFRLLVVAGFSITSMIAMIILERTVTAQYPNSLFTPNSPQSLTMVSFSLNNYQGKNRLLLVFAPSEQDSAYQTQKQLILGHQSQFDERDLRLIEVFANGKSHVDNQAINAASAARLRDRFHVSKDEFCIILVGKDGYEKRRDRTPIELARIFNQVDQMPMRQQEMRKQ